MFAKCLFPITFSLDLDNILGNALFLQKLDIRDFNLIHVVSSDLGSVSSAQDALQKSAEKIRKKGDFSVSAKLLKGHTASNIVYTAKESYYNLIFIPAQNKSIMNRTLLGSTTSDVIRMAYTPTLVYKHYSNEPMSWETVVFATDFQVAATRALPYVKALGQAASKLVILHVGTRAADPTSEAKRIEYIKKEFEDLKNILDPFWQEINTVTDLGNPSREIRSSLEKFNADLAVMGRSNTTFMKNLLGSTAERVSNSVETSVLLIP